MKLLFRLVFISFFWGGVLFSPLALAQNVSTVVSGDSQQLSVPKDELTRAKAHTELASLYFQNRNPIVALEELTFAISISQNYAPAYAMRGLVLYYINELDSADKDFKRALSLNEKDPEINNNYGWYLCHTGRVKESIEYFQKALRNPLYRTPELAYLNAATCHVKLGELDVAEEYVRKILRFMPDNPQGLFQMASIYYKRGNFDAARQHLMSVVHKDEPSAEVLWLLLRVERQLGDKMAESSLATQLRRKFPDSPEYQKLLKGDFE